MLLPKNRPLHPGVYIKEEVLNDLQLTQEQLANRLGVSRRTINELVGGKRSLTADMALRLAKFTQTSPETWLYFQTALDLWDAMHSDSAEMIDKITAFDYAQVAPEA